MFRPRKRVTSEEGEPFAVDKRVEFDVQGEKQTGTVVKQMKNAAIIAIDETKTNEELIFQTLGNIVISYKELKLID